MRTFVYQTIRRIEGFLETETEIHVKSNVRSFHNYCTREFSVRTFDRLNFSPSVRPPSVRPAHCPSVSPSVRPSVRRPSNQNSSLGKLKFGGEGYSKTMKIEEITNNTLLLLYCYPYCIVIPIVLLFLLYCYSYCIVIPIVLLSLLYC